MWLPSNLHVPLKLQQHLLKKLSTIYPGSSFPEEVICLAFTYRESLICSNTGLCTARGHAEHADIAAGGLVYTQAILGIHTDIVPSS